MTVEEFRSQAAAGVIKHHGLPESIAMVSDGLGLGVDEIIETIAAMVAAEQVVREYLAVEPGKAAGVHQIARGLSGGTEKIYMELRMFVGAKDSGDTVELTGHPNIRIVIPGGTHGDIATAAVVVNTIPAILDAPAGLRTSPALPLGFSPPPANPQ